MNLLRARIGSILKDGIIDSELVFNIYSPNMIIWTWEKFKPLVDMNRKMLNHSEYLGNFEYLYELTCEKYPSIVHRNDYRKELTDYLTQSPTET